MSANLENSAVATGLENVSFHSSPKEGQCQRYSNNHTVAFISHASTVMLKILQASLQQCVSQELPNVQMVTPDYLTCLLRNLYSGQEATIRTGYGTADWFKTVKGVWQGCIWSLCLFNLCAEYIMQMPCWINHKLESDVQMISL